MNVTGKGNKRCKRNSVLAKKVKENPWSESVSELYRPKKVNKR
jgi:hypothetical protein